MPWKETKVVTERMKFVLAVEAEPLESMTVLCARFGISRKTGYKWLKRFEGEGPRGLEDRASLARSISHRLPANVVLQVLELRKEHPFWGPKKLRARVTAPRTRSGRRTWAGQIPDVLSASSWSTIPSHERWHAPSEGPHA
jgi:hypothetical protein